jgi:metal-responsive CopG/Arc/MetJ family transcriptional regulator
MIIHMKAVQFTIDESLLKRIDRDPEVKAHGRSAFLRHAAEEYLRRRARRQIRDAYKRGYREQPPGADELSWPVPSWPAD